MTTQYITKFVNEYGQVNTHEALEAIRRAMRLRTYATAGAMIEELENLFNGEDYDNVNGELFFLTFDEEAELRRMSRQIEAKQEARQKDAEQIAEAKKALDEVFNELQDNGIIEDVQKTEAPAKFALNHKGEKITQYGNDFFKGFYVAGEDVNGAGFYHTCKNISEACKIVNLSHTALTRDVLRVDYR